jgi:hypothetical protein
MPQLTYAVVRRGVDDQVVGVTVNNCRLFVLRYPNHQQIEVYDTTTFKFQETMNIDGLSNDWSNGLTACVSNNCIYMNDYPQCTIHKVTLAADSRPEVIHWVVDDEPIGVSLNAERNLLIMLHAQTRLLEYSPNGSLVREIRLQLNDDKLFPFHAIQLTRDRFVVCLCERDISHTMAEDVVEMNSEGLIIVVYKDQLQSTTRRHFDRPRHLAVDSRKDRIFVADRYNDRIVILSRSQNRAREFDASSYCSDLRPKCLHLDDCRQTPRLYVGDDHGHVFVFDVN